MNGGVVVVLRRRLRASWLDKEKFSCPKCKNTDDDIGWNDKHSIHPRDEPEEVLFCKTCKYKLTEKKDLQELINFAEKIQIGFFLRFAGKHFNPCEKCQEEIDDIVLENLADIGNNNCVNLDQILISRNSKTNKVRKLWIFGFYFLQDILSNEEYSHLDFRPCDDCQKKLDKLWENSEIHIGNETKPMVEFWRRWTDDYDRQTVMEKLGLETIPLKQAEKKLKAYERKQNTA